MAVTQQTTGQFIKTALIMKTLKCCRKSDFINDYVYKTTRADGDSLSTMKNTNIYKSKKNNCEAERSRGLEVLLTNNE